MEENVTVYLDVLAVRIYVLYCLLTYLTGYWLGIKCKVRKILLISLLQTMIILSLQFFEIKFNIIRWFIYLIEIIIFSLSVLYCFCTSSGKLKSKKLIIPCFIAGLQAWLVMNLGNKTIGVTILLFFITFMIGGSKKKDTKYIVRFTFKDIEYETTAIVDTGNSLRDPYKHSPVCIVDKDVLKLRTADIIQDCLLVPFKSVGEEHGILKVIRVHNVLIYSYYKNNSEREKELELEEMLLGISDVKLSKDKEYQMLLHKEYIERM